MSLSVDNQIYLGGGDAVANLFFYFSKTFQGYVPNLILAIRCQVKLHILFTCCMETSNNVSYAVKLTGGVETTPERYCVGPVITGGQKDTKACSVAH